MPSLVGKTDKKGHIMLTKTHEEIALQCFESWIAKKLDMKWMQVKNLQQVQLKVLRYYE